MKFVNTLKADWRIALVLAMAALLVGWLTHLSPPAGDDLCVAAYGLSDYGRFVSEYYFGWGGRVVAHTFVFVFANFPDVIFDVANGLAFAGLLWLGALLVAGPARTVTWCMLALMGVLMFSQIPMFGEAVIWLSGSGNYLWTMLLIFGFLLPYRWLAGGRDVLGRYGILGALGFGMVAIISGWTNENTGAAAWGVALLLALDALWQQRKTKRWTPPLWALAGLAGQLVGILGMVLAPGNAVRMAHPNVQKAMAVSSDERVTGYLEHIRDYLFQPWPMVFIFVVFGFVMLRRGLWWTLKTNVPARLIVIWGLGATAAVGILLFAPYVEQRALTSGWMFLALGSVACALELRTVYPRLTAAWGVLVGMLAAWFAFGALQSYALLAQQHALVEAELAACQADGRAMCLVTPYRVESDRYMYMTRIAQIQPHADDAYNVCRAQRLGVPALRARYRVGDVY